MLCIVEVTSRSRGIRGATDRGGGNSQSARGQILQRKRCEFLDQVLPQIGGQVRRSLQIVQRRGWILRVPVRDDHRRALAAEPRILNRASPIERETDVAVDERV